MQYLPEKDYDLPGLDLLTLLFESQLSLTTESTILHAEAADSTNHITKAQTRTIAKRLAHVFRSEFGIGADGPGKDAVMCISANQVLLPAVFYGIIGAGGVYAAASTALTTPEVSKQLRQSRSKVIVTCPENRAKARDAARECGIPPDRVLVLESMEHRRTLCNADNSGRNYLQTKAELEWERIVDIDTLENTTICLLYSSGTTGPPKGVMLSHMNLVSEALFTQLVLRDSKKEKAHLDVPYRTVGHLPTAHIAGCLGSFITPAVAGGTVYWMPRFRIDEFIDYCKKYAVTFLSTAPPVYHAIVRSERVTDQFKTLVRAESGAAPLSLELQEQAERKLGCTISQRWGMTESTGSVTTMPWGQSDNTGDISPLLPNMRLRLVDERMRDVRSGDEGEILLKGPMITKGYFNNPEATAEAFTPDGWYKTGDIGVYKNGKIIMVDRKKELIKYKGLQVSPVEVEGFLLTHASVADVAVVGAPDPEAPGNELPRAYVVIKAGSRVSEEELKEYVKSNLAGHKQLRGGVVFIDEIPRSASGKILRRILRDQARSSTGRQAKL
ncbi:putative acyl-coenzyme A synthetase [Aspergillus similis]